MHTLLGHVDYAASLVSSVVTQVESRSVFEKEEIVNTSFQHGLPQLLALSESGVGNFDL